MENWHNLGIDESLHRLSVKPTGLADDESVKRRIKYGTNELETRKKISRFIVFLNQFKSPLIYVLAVAAIVSFVIGHTTDAFVILGILLLNATIGFFQETQAEKSMNALLELASPKAKVRWDNQTRELGTLVNGPGSRTTKPSYRP
jgi:Ca2+-transporting ATPase